jgi:hypothetical protein
MLAPRKVIDNLIHNCGALNLTRRAVHRMVVVKLVPVDSKLIGGFH